MRNLFISQVVIPILGVVFNILLGVIAFYIKTFWNKHKNVLELQRQQLIQKIGIDKYNADVVKVKEAVYAAEQLGKEFDWNGTLKHSKVLEMIEGKTGLTDDQIFNIIKSLVGEMNSNKVVSLADNDILSAK